MQERYFFDIPVFRCTQEKWNNEEENIKKKMAQRLADGGSVDMQRALKFTEDWLSYDFRSYRYSEMIGMIRLYAMNQQIKGEIFFVGNNRIPRNLKDKKWKYYGKLFEFMIHEGDTNRTIFENIIDRIERNNQNKNGILFGRVIDMEAFLNTGSLINYMKLVNQ